MGRLKRALFIVAGTVCVGLGVLGIFLPLMPATPFFLLAAFFYSRSSDRFLHWLLNNKYCGPYIRNFRAGRGMPLRAKIVTLGLMWVTMGLTAVFLPAWWMRGLLLCVALGVTGYVCFRLKTLAVGTEMAGEAPAAPPTPAEAD